MFEIFIQLNKVEDIIETYQIADETLESLLLKVGSSEDFLYEHFYLAGSEDNVKHTYKVFCNKGFYDKLNYNKTSWTELEKFHLKIYSK